MTQFDKQYNSIIKDIMNNGISDEEFNVRTKWDSDGTPAHTLSVMSKQMRFDNSEVPILTTKKVAWKTAIKELLWIWQLKSNDVNDLRQDGRTYLGSVETRRRHHRTCIWISAGEEKQKSKWRKSGSGRLSSSSIEEQPVFTQTHYNAVES